MRLVVSLTLLLLQALVIKQSHCFLLIHNNRVIISRENGPVEAETALKTTKQQQQRRKRRRNSLLSLKVARYGPQTPPPNSRQEEEDDDREQDERMETAAAAASILERHQYDTFRRLVQQILTAQQPEHIPRILANHMELIMSLQGEQGTKIITDLLEEVKAQDVDCSDNDDDNDDDNSFRYGQTVQAVELILSFAEDFVQQAQEMDNHNKQLLGKIIKTMMMTNNDNDDDVNSVSSIRDGVTKSPEELLDLVMEEEKAQFTPGFLRHLEGECDRISGAPKMTRESARLLEILRIIQTRVLEELGKEMGEATLVLGQLMGYDSEEELLGVLDAGLTVRGTDFAMEMASLTKEALDGFQRVPGGVDPELVERVTFIDRRLQEYLVDVTNEFQ
ncbi:hypothetical protein IV203_023242 [Nitzschia inconspicua]|uniref:Uncharacterized protein n=1 Tax=Nitzschia inconspicua TaxID=303405 RepID=A0A9K3PC40_9STRA|nr:hypothetical protein IV203_023234 [Nitzschia inconspicua]KAG7341291.1 hypothetical protein IV203_023242 [Nitzschia inconspicua]